MCGLLPELNHYLLFNEKGMPYYPDPDQLNQNMLVRLFGIFETFVENQSMLYMLFN
jgi:hypothetical protein